MGPALVYSLAPDVTAQLQRAYRQLTYLRNRWRYRTSIGGIDAEFAMTTPYEITRSTTFLGEEAVLEAFLDHLDGDEVVWDIGATVGTYSCFTAQKLSSGVVVGFEPEPANESRLRENLQRNASAATWQTSRFALSNVNERSSLAFDDTPSRRGQPGAGHYYLSDTGSIPVDCRRGADLIRRGYPAPDVLKIDVQGAEKHVLEGLGDALSDVEWIVAEVHLEKSHRYGYAASAVRSFLEDANFTVTDAGNPSVSRSSDVRHVFAHREGNGDGPTAGT